MTGPMLFNVALKALADPPVHMRENGSTCPFGVFPCFIVLFAPQLDISL